jgi:hypothetical protein
LPFARLPFPFFGITGGTDSFTFSSAPDADNDATSGLCDTGMTARAVTAPLAAEFTLNCAKPPSLLPHHWLRRYVVFDDSYTRIGTRWSDSAYANDTSFEDIFTGAEEFTVKEIEVFNIAD